LQALTGLIAVLGTGIAGFALARLPPTEIRIPLYAFVLSAVLWGVGDLTAASATEATTKQLGVAIFYSGAIAIPALWWVVALRWADEVGAALPLRAAAWRRLPLWWAGAMWLVMITNPWHGAFITPVVGGRNLYQPLWFVMAIPGYAQILAALALEVAVARKSVRSAVRHQAWFLIAASVVTLSGSLVYVTGIVSLNLTVAMLSISMSLLVVGMAREGLFGVMPAALRAIAADHPDGVVVVGPDGHVGYANQRARQLLEPVILQLDRPLVEILQDPALQPETPLSFAPEPSSNLWRVFSGPTGALFRIDALTPRWLQVVASSVGGARSGASGHVLLLSDVTERRHAELRARRLRRLDSVTSLARSISRDFQGAFTIVLANADLLAAKLGDDPSQRYLARIFEAARLGADVAYQLQLYTGAGDGLRVNLELAEVVAEACSLVERDLPPSVGLHNRPPGRPLPIDADPIQVRDCIFGLLMNAIEATSDGEREIEVITGVDRFDPGRTNDLVCGTEQPPGDFAYVRIRDEGGGMDPEVEERAFEPFFSTRQKDRGSGLSSVLGIARAHDAVIGLQNDPGWGCTFTVYFPLRDE
jgi:signal transduction histidine kinase